GQHVVVKKVELRGGERCGAVPPHRLVGEAVADDELVLRAAAGMYAGVGGERPAGGEFGFAAPDCLLNQNRGDEVDARLTLGEEIHGLGGSLRRNAQGNGPVPRWTQGPISHGKSSQKRL